MLKNISKRGRKPNIQPTMSKVLRVPNSFQRELVKEYAGMSISIKEAIVNLALGGYKIVIDSIDIDSCAAKKTAFIKNNNMDLNKKREKINRKAGASELIDATNQESVRVTVIFNAQLESFLSGLDYSVCEFIVMLARFKFNEEMKCYGRSHSTKNIKIIDLETEEFTPLKLREII